MTDDKFQIALLSIFKNDYATDPASRLLFDHAFNVGRWFEYPGGIKHRSFDAGKIEIIGKEDLVSLVKDALSHVDSRVLAVYGHGRYHHLAYGLTKLADRISEDYGYIHIDNHHDAWKRDRTIIDCASFVQHILSDTNAQSVFFIGSNPFLDSGSALCDTHRCPDLRLGYPALRATTPWAIDEYFHEIFEFVPQHDVYLSIDLDVMDESEIETGYSRGKMTKETLLHVIGLIKKQKCIIGADVLGFRPYHLIPTDSVIPPERHAVYRRSLALYDDIIKTIIGEPPKKR